VGTVFEFTQIQIAKMMLFYMMMVGDKGQGAQRLHRQQKIKNIQKQNKTTGIRSYWLQANCN